MHGASEIAFLGLDQFADPHTNYTNAIQKLRCQLVSDENCNTNRFPMKLVCKAHLFYCNGCEHTNLDIQFQQTLVCKEEGSFVVKKEFFKKICNYRLFVMFKAF